jgi:CMP-N-acetylneuraminic acid synthetase
MIKIIAMIPARMGSKRVPKKNIRFLCGKALIQYAIHSAQASGCFDEIWVNSESKIIGELALLSGVKFHHRPEKFAMDQATNQDFTAEFLHTRKCDYVVMVNPTSPLLKPETIQKFCSYTLKGEYDTVLSVLEERAECFFNGKPVNFYTQKKLNSQELEPFQKVVWAITAWRRDHFLAVSGKGQCSVFSGKLGRFPIPLKEACDIDTQEEWDLAENLLLAEQLSLKGKEKKIKYWEKPHEN